jgi:hypothetical protein
MDGGGDKSALASELAQVLAMVRELEARMDQDPLPAAARELCAGLASSVDRSIRIARSCCADLPDGNAAAQSKRRQVDHRSDSDDRSCLFRRSSAVPVTSIIYASSRA